MDERAVRGRVGRKGRVEEVSSFVSFLCVWDSKSRVLVVWDFRWIKGWRNGGTKKIGRDSDFVSVSRDVCMVRLSGYCGVGVGDGDGAWLSAVEDGMRLSGRIGRRAMER